MNFTRDLTVIIDMKKENFTVHSLISLLNPTFKSKKEKSLLDVNTPIDSFGNTFLHLSVAQKDFGLLSVLLLKGANPNCRNYASCTPLRLAHWMDFEEGVQILMKHGAKQEDFSDLAFKSLLDDQIQHGDNTVESIQLDTSIEIKNPRYRGRFISNSAYLGISGFSKLLLNIPDEILESDNILPLMKSAFKGHSKVIDELLQSQTQDVKAVDGYGYNSLVWACLGGNLDCFFQLYLTMDVQFMKSSLEQCYGTKYPLTLLTAAIQGQNPNLVEKLIQLGCDVDQKVGNIYPIQIALWMGNQRIIDIVARKAKESIEMLSSDTEWYHIGLKHLDCFLSTDQGKKSNSVQAHVDQMGLSRRAPHTNSLISALSSSLKSSRIANMKDDVLHDVSGLEVTDPDPKQLSEKDLICRNQANKILAYEAVPGQDEGSAVNFGEIFGIREPDDTIGYLLNLFQSKGTWLEFIHMQMVYQVIQLMLAIKEEKKTEYVVISGKAIQQIDEVVRAIDQWCNKEQKNHYNIFFNSEYYLKIRSLNQRLKDHQMKKMLTSTKSAVAAWPPPNAVENMKQAALQTCLISKQLVSFASESGHWPIASIDVEFLKDGGNGREKVARKLDYVEYQRQAETKILEEINQTKRFSFSDNFSTKSCPDDKFFDSLENWIRQVEHYEQKLISSVESNRKEDYVSLASALYARYDALIEETRPYYLFNDLSADFRIDFSTDKEPFIRILRNYCSEILKNGDNCILRAKIASGFWPPENATQDMLDAAKSCKKLSHELIDYVKKACSVIRETEDEQRKKIESYMEDWNSNARVRNLFAQWEKVKISSTKDDGDDNDSAAANRAQLSANELSLLDEGLEGLIVERKDGKMLIKGGKLVKMIEVLTSHIYGDNDFRNAFILTHHSFTASSDLLDLLIKRYEISPPYGLDQRKFELYLNRKVIPIRSRVFNVIKYWMRNYSEEFRTNRDLSRKCLNFVKEKVRVDFGALADQILLQLKRNLESSAEEPIKYTSGDFPRPILPGQVKEGQLLKYLLKDPLEFMNIDPLELARQITLVDRDAFTAIQAKEFLDQGWEKPDKDKRSPNVTQMIRNTNNLTFWVVTSIVTCKNIRQRVTLLKYFISVAEMCAKLNNYNALTAFIAGLSQGPVHRMSKTWKQLKEKHSKHSDLFATFSEYVSPKGQYATYRAMVKTSKPPIIPFLGVSLTDLTFVALGNPDYLPDNNFINFDKRYKVASLIGNILINQTNTHQLKPVDGIREFILQLGSKGWMSEKEFYEESKEAEPMEED